MTNRVVLGQKGSDYGLWVSQPGFDVLTTSDVNMLFSMNGLLYQIFQKGSFSITGASTTIALSSTGGNIPQVVVYRHYNGLYDPSIFYSEVSTTQLTIFNPDATGTWDGFYICFAETAT